MPFVRSQGHTCNPVPPCPVSLCCLCSVQGAQLCQKGLNAWAIPRDHIHPWKSRVSILACGFSPSQELQALGQARAWSLPSNPLHRDPTALTARPFARLAQHSLLRYDFSPQFSSILRSCCRPQSCWLAGRAPTPQIRDVNVRNDG